MFIKNRKELKQVTSRIHTLLKAGKIPQSHNQSLEFLAQALGLKSAAELQTILPPSFAADEAASRKTATAELKNLDGGLDLVLCGQIGKVVKGTDFQVADGTVEDIQYCLAYADEGVRTEQRIAFDYIGETRINWDAQVTRKSDSGRVLWDFDGTAFSEEYCLLAPSDFEQKDSEGLLPVRLHLVEHYAKLIEALGTTPVWIAGFDASADFPAYQTLCEKVAFGLHKAERAALQEQLLAFK